MNRIGGLSRKRFFSLPDNEVADLVEQKGKPKTGVFIADGTRRLILSQKRLEPDSKTFHQEYVRFFADKLKESLETFFNHGLETLFFPLFGPSLLKRKNLFQTVTIPYFYREVFESAEWEEFFQRNGIAVKAYGDLSRLDEIDTNGLGMREGILSCVNKTRNNGKRSVFFGFMSEVALEGSIPERIVKLYDKIKRVPTNEEIIADYYGQKVRGIDFILFSNQMSMKAIPPLLTTSQTKSYFFPVPGFLAFNKTSYREILFDYLYNQPGESLAQFSAYKNENADFLASFYEKQTHTIIGTCERVGEFLLPDLRDNCFGGMDEHQ